MSQDPAGAVVLITRLARAAHRQVDQQSLGMTLKEFTALSALRDISGRGQKELGEALLLDPNSLSLLLNSLEDRGLVARRPDPQDRRRHLVDLTGAGVRSVTKAEAAIDAAAAGLLDSLSVDERAELKRLTAKALGDH